MWPFKKKKEEKEIDNLKAMGLDDETLNKAMEKLKELSDNKICFICGNPVGENDYETLEVLGTTLYMHKKCKKKLQKQLLKLMRSGQLNKILEQYAQLLKNMDSFEFKAKFEK